MTILVAIIFVIGFFWISYKSEWDEIVMTVTAVMLFVIFTVTSGFISSVGL